MGVVFRIFALLGAPFRWVARLFTRQGGAALKKSATAGYARGKSATLAYAQGKIAEMDAQLSGGGASRAANEDDVAPQGAEGYTQRTLFFKAAPHFQLRHKASAGYSLNAASEELAIAKAYFDNGFDLFPGEEFFYEDIERDFLAHALNPFRAKPETISLLRTDGEGRKAHGDVTIGESVDENFLHNIESFRAITDANSRRLLLIITPLIIAAALIGAIGAMFVGPVGALSETVAEALMLGGLAILAWAAIGMFYLVSYNSQQRYNVVALRAYVSDKFNRIQQNILRVKDTLIQLHLNKTIRDEKLVREEVEVWSGALLWLITRLTFCEFTIRNTVFRIWRDAFLMHVAGQLACFVLLLLVLACAPFIAAAAGASQADLSIAVLKLSAMAVVMIGVAYWGIMRRPIRLVAAILASNNWTRLSDVKVLDILTEVISVDKLEIIRTRSKQIYGSGGDDSA